METNKQQAVLVLFMYLPEEDMNLCLEPKESVHIQ